MSLAKKFFLSTIGGNITPVKPAFINNTINQITVQSDDKPIVRLSNTGLYGAIPYSDLLLRLNNSDLLIDNTFNYPNYDSGTNSYTGGVRTVIQSDNKIISVAENISPTLSNYRYNTYGTLDGTYTSAFTTGTTNRSAIIKSDNEVLTIKESALNQDRVQLWQTSGALDATFSCTPNNSVINCAFDNLGGVYLRGTFTQVNGVTKSRLFKVLNTGLSDTTFNNGITTGTTGNIFTIGVQSDNKMVGGFTTYNSISYNRLIRLNTNGTIDATFTCPTSFQPTSILVLPNDKVLCWGTFTSVGGDTNIKGICRLNANGTLDTGFNNDVHLDLPFYDTTNGVSALGTIGGSNSIYIACFVGTDTYIYKLDSNGNFLI